MDYNLYYPMTLNLRIISLRDASNIKNVVSMNISCHPLVPVRPTAFHSFIVHEGIAVHERAPNIFKLAFNIKTKFNCREIFALFDLKISRLCKPTDHQSPFLISFLRRRVLK